MSIIGLACGPFNKSLGSKWYLNQLNHFSSADTNQDFDKFKTTIRKILENLMKAAEHERDVEPNGNQNQKSPERPQEAERLIREHLPGTSEVSNNNSNSHGEDPSSQKLHVQINELMKENSDLKARMAFLDFDLLKQKERLEQFTNRNGELEETIRNAHFEAERLHHTIQDLVKEVGSLTYELKSQDQEIGDLKRERESKRRLIEDLDDDICDRKKELRDKQMDAEEYREKCFDWHYCYRQAEKTIAQKEDCLRFMFRLSELNYTTTRDFQEAHSEHVLALEEGFGEMQRRLLEAIADVENVSKSLAGAKMKGLRLKRKMEEIKKRVHVHLHDKRSLRKRAVWRF